MSLSEEWAELSAALYGPEFIKSLANFLTAQNVKTILECACGDGHVLNGLADKIESGVGIDTDEYLIGCAKRGKHPVNITYKKVDVTDMDNDPDLRGEMFDAVMMRGNSTTSLGAWGTDKNSFSPERCDNLLREALIKMWRKVKRGGILYLDVTKQEDIDRGDHTLNLEVGSVRIVGEIIIDRKHKRRDALGHGMVRGRLFNGGTSTYLIGPGELKEIIKELLNPREIWTPTEVKDAMYEIICARK